MEKKRYFYRIINTEITTNKDDIFVFETRKPIPDEVFNRFDVDLDNLMTEDQIEELLVHLVKEYGLRMMKFDNSHLVWSEHDLGHRITDVLGDGHYSGRYGHYFNGKYDKQLKSED